MKDIVFLQILLTVQALVIIESIIIHHSFHSVLNRLICFPHFLRLG